MFDWIFVAVSFISLHLYHISFIFCFLKIFIFAAYFEEHEHTKAVLNMPKQFYKN